jgi:SAM-dependent methyltransferase
MFGFIDNLSLPEELHSVGGAWPEAAIGGVGAGVNARYRWPDERCMESGSLTDTPLRLNIGCGQTPTPGWRNYDNSPTVRLARLPLPLGLLSTCRLVGAANREFFETCRRFDIRFASAVAIPEANASVDAIYSSHMLEHLDGHEARRFMAECRRILKPGGVLRIAVPDLKIGARVYLEGGATAQQFMEWLEFDYDKPRGLSGWLRHMLVGHRGHFRAYDGPTLLAFAVANGFADAHLLPGGATAIAEPGALDLHERDGISLYLEATRGE